MKQLIQCSVLSTLLLSQSALAINAIQGFYIGVLGEMSFGPDNYPYSIDVYYPSLLPLSGSVNNSSIGGGGAFAVGFRMQKFRVEGELLYNYIKVHDLTVGSCTYSNPNFLTPTGSCPPAAIDNSLGFLGNTSTVYGLANVYFDFINYNSDKALVPYLGVGIGGVYIRKSGEFTNRQDTISVKDHIGSTAAAAQGIIGLSYYLDDYAWLGIDYRYLSTGVTTTFNFDSRYNLNTINLNANFSFDNASFN